MELKGKALERQNKVRELIGKLELRFKENGIELTPCDLELWDDFDTACGEHIFLGAPKWEEIRDLSRIAFYQIFENHHPRLPL